MIQMKDMYMKVICDTKDTTFNLNINSFNKSSNKVYNRILPTARSEFVKGANCVVSPPSHHVCRSPGIMATTTACHSK